MTVDEALSALAKLVGLGPPASIHDIAAAERRLGFQIAGEWAAFYLRANGTTDHTPVENGWTRLWMVDEWRPVRTLGYGPLYADVDRAAVIADYSLESWWYAAGPEGVVYIVDGLRQARVVAAGLSEFVRMLVEDHVGTSPP